MKGPILNGVGSFVYRKALKKPIFSSVGNGRGKIGLDWA